MALVHQLSCPCLKTELDLFTPPPTQVAIEHGQWVEYHPVSTLTDQGPVEFLVSGSGEDYLDLANTILYARVRLVKKNGALIMEGEEVKAGPVNLWLHSLFSQVDMSLNEKLVSSANNTYAYRSYIESLLGLGPAARRSQLTASMWVKDTAGKMNDVDGDENEGLAARGDFLKRSKAVDMAGRVHCDMFFQQRYLVNGVDLKLKMTRSKDTFSLMGQGAGEDAAAGPDVKINLMNVSLYVRKVRLAPPVMSAHQTALQKGTAKYPIRRVDCKVFSIPRGNLVSNQENLFLGQIPTRIVLGCVDNAAYSGVWGANPFNFQHFGLNFLALYVDGMQIPFRPLQPNFERARYAMSYLSLFSGTGLLYEDTGNGISYGEYPDGFCLFAFDLTADLSHGEHFNLLKQGNIRVEIHFSQPLEATVNVVVYAEFENIIEVDQNRNVLFDFTS